MVLYFYSVIIDHGYGRIQYTSGTFNANFQLESNDEFSKAFEAICKHHNAEKSQVVITAMNRL